MKKLQFSLLFIMLIGIIPRAVALKVFEPTSVSDFNCGQYKFTGVLTKRSNRDAISFYAGSDREFVVYLNGLPTIKSVVYENELVSIEGQFNTKDPRSEAPIIFKKWVGLSKEYKVLQPAVLLKQHQCNQK